MLPGNPGQHQNSPTDSDIKLEQSVNLIIQKKCILNLFLLKTILKHVTLLQYV